jgi:hypothetical protein
MKVFENLLNFFSLALKSSATIMSVIPATSININGQYCVISPGAKNETTNPDVAIRAVKMVRLRINRFSNSFIKSGSGIYIFGKISIDF